MAEATRGWQPCRENLCPPQVREEAPPTLNEGPPGIQQQRQQFEAQLLVSSGSEALDVWDRYVTWSLQVVPDGQRAELQPLLERAVMQFADKSYFSDPRYTSLWIQLAQNSPVPADMFRYMDDQELGRRHAVFYVTWAQHLEARGEFQHAERVLREGLIHKAQPRASIQQCLRSVQGRLSGGGGTGGANSPPRISQVDLKPRGRKRTAKSAGCSLGVNLQLPEMALRAQSLPLQGPGAPAPEDPHTSRGPGGNTTCGDLQEELKAARPLSGEQAPSAAPAPATAVSEERSMYCKELLTQGMEEVCFEEVRARRYTLAQRQEVHEKIRKMDDLEEKLNRELQEKQRMLLLRMSLPETLEKVDEVRNLPVDEPFHIFTDPSSGSSSSSSSAMPLRTSPLTNDVFLRPGEKCQALKTGYPCPGGGLASENSHSGEGSGARHLSLTEAVVGTVQNKTLCSSPDNTWDFAVSAHLVSTPSGRRAPPTQADHRGALSQRQGRTAPPPPQPEATTTMKLSPIQEASLEAHTTLTSAGPSCSSSAPQTGEGPLLRDPCSAETRQRLLDQAGVSSFPGYHTVGTPFPPVDQDTRLSLGSMVVSLHAQILEGDGFSVFAGFSHRSHVVLKVGRSLLPWDFYVASELQRRRGPGDSALPHASCFMFLDACVTVYTSATEYRRLSEWVDTSQPWGGASMVCGLLRMMTAFHSSSLLLGAVASESLLCTDGEVHLSVELLSSLDLKLQTDLVSAAQIPAARDHIQQGLLKASDSPYQVDLVYLAEVVHLLLTQRKMEVVEEEDGWMVEKLGRNAARFGRKSAWRRVFHLLLNPSGRSSVSVLAQVLDLVDTVPSW